MCLGRRGVHSRRVDDGTLTVLYMALVLKIPIAAMLGIIWWAVRSQPEIEVEPEDRDDFRRRSRDPHPRTPRRGPGSVLPRPQTEGRVRAASRAYANTPRQLPD